MRCPGWPCDSAYAIYPEIYTKEAEWVKPEDILARLKGEPSRNVTLTGGEPFLQRDDDLQELALEFWRRGYSVDIFTNGSRIFPNWVFSPRVTVIMDWKLKGSGEASTGLSNRQINRHQLSFKDAVKFVVKDLDDMREAQDLLTLWGEAPVHQVYMGPVWGAIEPAELVAFIKEHGMYACKLNLQTHKYVWPAEERGI
jgi:7-carboxy-7-deazaguanine synthase